MASSFKEPENRQLVEERISDDRQFLDVLNLSDAEAAMYLGKSRQALNGKLGSKRAGDAPCDYFKPSEMVVLVIASRHKGGELDEGKLGRIRDYAERTRAPRHRESGGGGAYALLEKLLHPAAGLDLREAHTVVLILPDYHALSERESAARLFEELVANQRTVAPKAKVVILSSTNARARAAMRSLPLAGADAHAFAHENADYYLPMVLVYDRSCGLQSYVLTDANTFVGAPQYNVPLMTECVRSMVPEDSYEALFPKAC